MTTIKERILTFLEYKSVTISRFFPDIGISYSSFKGPQLLSSPSSSVLAKIKAKFPDINIDWVLSGEGNMLIQQHDPGPDSEQITTSILEQIKENHAIFEQNNMILKKNQEILRQNAELIRQAKEMCEKLLQK